MNVKTTVSTSQIARFVALVCSASGNAESPIDTINLTSLELAGLGQRWTGY
jgi:hypothetical protein